MSTHQAVESAPKATSGAAKKGFRPDLEGVRAVAVLLVVLYHAGLAWLPGGYVGVDVFYVLSGFFITGLLVSEAQRSGRIRLAPFYARRGRRLLPAATLVIVATAVASWFIYPPLRAVSLGWDAITSALDVANFRYAFQATDYLASSDEASPFLHFWSLAVEEQFYWVWPLLVMLAIGAFAARRLNPRRLVIVLSVVTVASFAACVWLTRTDQPWAFFLLPTRAWELAVGALLALGVARLRAIPAAFADLLGLLGLGAIVAASVLFTDATAFPGYAAALPVAGTAALIAAGAASRGGVSALLSLAPMRAIGRWSYSIYLWHWPLLILPAVAVGATLPGAARAGLVLASIAAGALTFRFLEDPLRRSPSLSASTGRSLALSAGLVLAGTAAGAALVIGGTNATGGSGTAPAPTPTAPAQPSAREAALDAAAVAPQPVPANLTPSLLDPKADLARIYADRCHGEFAEDSFGDCVYGAKDGTRTVFLVGDSHAAHWFDAMEQIARDNDLRLVSLTKSGCPLVSTTLPSPTNPGGEYIECRTWNEAVLARIDAEQPDLVVVSGSREILRERYDGLTDMLTRLTGAGHQVLVLGDTARQSVDVPECLSGNLDNALACADSAEKGIDAASQDAMAASAAQAGAAFTATAPWLCTDTVCPVVVGNLLMYRDASHLTTAASRWLAPTLEPVIVAALGVTPADQ